MHGRTGIPVDLAQRIPLNKTDPQWSKFCIDRPMISMLCPLDQKPEGLERMRHNPILYKWVYIGQTQKRL
jgi:hypothetical protein